MPLLLRSIRSGKRQAALAKLPSIAKDMLVKALDKEVKPLLITSHERVVASWKNQPEFQTRKFITSSLIKMTVFPAGDKKAVEIYGYVDKGTKPHLIVPKRAKFLRFKLGYQPKTLPNPARVVIHPSGGTATGPEVWAKLVHHPGSEARNFSEALARDIQPKFNSTIDNTFRQISRKVEE